MSSIARSELIQLLRNRSVLVTSLLMPLAASVFFIANPQLFEGAGGNGYVSAVLVFTIAAFGLYSTTVTTLAGRRQTLFLKRLRSTTASDTAILSGLLLPVGVISTVQVGVLLTVFAAVNGAPVSPVLTVVAVVAAFVMLLALGIATAGVTTSPEHAQVTTLPIALGTVIVASWVGIAGTESLTALKRTLPGGAATELILEAWNGGLPLADTLPLLVPTVAWAVVAVALASRMFRWEPRR